MVYLHELLGVSIVTRVPAIANQGARKLGRKWYVTQESLEAYFQQPEEQPEGEEGSTGPRQLSTRSATLDARM